MLTYRWTMSETGPKGPERKPGMSTDKIVMLSVIALLVIAFIVGGIRW